MSAPQKEPLFDIVQATHKAEQTTLWLHKMLRDTSLGLEKKLFAVDQSILYIARLNRLSGRTMVLPPWLEPLWKLWTGGRAATPPTAITEKEIAKVAADDVRIALSPMFLAPPNESASLRLSPELFQLMTHYPLHATQMSAEPISTSEDVDMEPPKVSADGGEIVLDTALLKKVEQDVKRKDTWDRDSSAPRGRIGPRGGRIRSRGLGRVILKVATTKKPVATRSAAETRLATAKSRLCTLLDDPGFLYHTIDVGKFGACDRCQNKGVPCHVPLPGATVGGEVVNWNSCGQCHIGKTGCSLVALPTNVIPKKDFIDRSQSRGSSRRQSTPLDELELETNGDDGGGEDLQNIGNDDSYDYPLLKPFGHNDAKEMLVSVKTELSSHEACVREMVDNAVNTSQRAVLKDLEDKHNALMKENEEWRKLYLSEMTAHRTSLDNLAKLLQLKDRLTDRS